MPTYEFRCPDGHTFDRFYRKISDGVAELPCPECGKTAVRQLSAGAGLVFKGSGFYLTDYGKNAHRGGDAPAGGGEGKGEGKGEAKGESPSGSVAETKSSDSSTRSDSKASESKPASAPAAPAPAPKPKSDS